ncbi:hypothetical protein ACLOJK_037977 [Asimina triloba]
MMGVDTGLAGWLPAGSTVHVGGCAEENPNLTFSKLKLDRMTCLVPTWDEEEESKGAVAIEKGRKWEH